MATASPGAVQPDQKPSGGRIVPFGKYLLLQRVSVGGMAEIFKAVPEGAKRLDNILAIKRILPNIAEDAEFIGMFVDEARTAGQLTHRNIGRIYELGKVGDTHYIAMQFLWGRDLLKVINRFKRVGRNMPPPMVAFVGVGALAGLHYAHTKCDVAGQPLEIIHRDVSPQNLLIGYSGQVKVIDFGVARAASQNQKTQAGVLKGKFGYMSPEMIKGLGIDQRSDVFAMGICLWEALTGQRLFYGDSDFSTLELVREAKVDPPSTKVADVPPELDAVIMKALASEPDDRWADAGEMQAALEAVLAEQYSGFGESDVATIMRQAFAHEVGRERQRLSIFDDMMTDGTLLRGAELPPLPPELPSGDEAPPTSTTRETDDPNATVVQPVSDEDLARLSGQFDGLHEEPTMIFFSAGELEEIKEIEEAPADVELIDDVDIYEEINPLDIELEPEQVPVPAVADVIMPGQYQAPRDTAEMNRWADLSAFDALPAEPISMPLGRPTPTGGYSRGVASRTMQIPLDRRHLSAPRGQQRTWALIAVALLLGLVTYAGVRALRPSTGTLEVTGAGAPSALVRVDGVMRGNLPLRMEGVAAGIHSLQVQAPGFRHVQRQVVVQRGRVTPINIVLERQAKVPTTSALPSIGPVPKIAPAPPTAVEGTGSASARERNARREARRERRRARREASGGGAQQARAGVEPPPAQGQAQQPAPAPPPAAAQDNTPGELMISTLPWSRVFVDNVDTGRDTPVRSLKTSPGRHTVGLRTPDGQMHLVEVLVQPGQQVRVIRRF